MVQSQYSLTWETFKSSVCEGFTSLQQNGELVDMTLAADGYFVKVHQVLMALVSPYLKELITSAPCQHPVIFLNNVSHETLGQLLEYVYTGEVMVPHENFNSFIQAGRALHIKGLDDMNQHYDYVAPAQTQGDDATGVNTSRVSQLKRLAVDTNIVRDRRSASAKTMKLSRKPLVQQEQSFSQPDDSTSYLMMESAHDTDDDDMPATEHKHDVSVNHVKDSDNAATSIQFSMSIRGCLQAILNRYIYNMHSAQSKTGMKRWRCVDYRNYRCQAYLVTSGNTVKSRANLHNHPFHDQKILQKIEKKSIFTAIEDAKTYQEEQKQAEEENIITTEWKKEQKSSDVDA